VGADADVVIFDPHRQVTLTAESLHHNVDYTPYEGWIVTGYPATVLSRGETIVRDSHFVGRAGRGEYLPAAPLICPDCQSL
jgi:dihydropyrimidinase